MMCLNKTILGNAVAGAVLSLVLVMPGVSAAQSFKSTSEILGAFDRQREAINDPSRGSACPSGDCGNTRGIKIYDESVLEGGGDKPVVTTSPAPASSGAVVRAEPSAPARSNTGSRNRPAVTPVSLPTLPEGQRLDLVILFDYDSAFIRPASRPQLQALCDAISQTQTSDNFAIIGHTDAAGASRYNLKLSQRRAKEVRRHLISECGIPGSRLQAFGLGEERLLDDVAGRSERQRRVEIQLNVSS